MNHTPPYKLLLLLPGLVAVLGVTGCGKTEQSSSQPGAEKPSSQKSAHVEEKPAGSKIDAGHAEEKRLKLSEEEIQTAGIKVAELQQQDINEQIMVTATIQANQNKLAHVSPRVPGKVINVYSNLGDRVKQGQTLALIDSIEVGEAQSSYAQAESEYALARANFERVEKLYADQIIPQKEFLRVRAEFEKAKAVLRAASEKRKMLGVAGLSPGATAGASVYPIVAPFSGTIIEKDAVLGELAQPDKFLFSIADLATVWIEANLFEQDLGKVKTGAEALVTVAAYPTETFKGRVTYISSTMDKETRTVKARVEVPNPDGRLKLDMFATAAISTPTMSKALLLPDEAVVLVQGQPTAFVEEQGGFEPRAVELGEKLRGRTILKAGVKVGEKLVVSGAYALKARLLKSQIGAAN